MKAALKNEFRQQRRILFGRKRYWFHIVTWVLVLLGSIFARQEFMKGLNAGLAKSGNMGRMPNIMVFLSASGIGALTGAIMVYLFLLLVIPYAHYKRRKRYLWLGIGLNALIWAATLVITGMVVGYRKHGGAGGELAGVAVGVIVSVSLLITSYFFSLYYFLDLYDQQRHLNRYHKVLTDKMHAETSFLKTQINPHFLFNTLNNIYSLALKKSVDAQLITRKLKDLIHYMLTDCSKDMVPLEGEIEFLRNYISLEQLRNKQEQVQISLELNGTPGQLQIAPMLLINFIENAFKHGVKSGIEQAFVRIGLSVSGNNFSMELINSRPAAVLQGSRLAVKQEGGIGIRNVKRRLELLYPHKHQLRIRPLKQEYRVHLNIDLS